jgi:hypothetical protein
MTGTDRSLLLALLIALAAPGDSQAAVPGAGPSRGGIDRSAADGWSGGLWTRGFHEGRFGWWWTVGPSRYWYAQPAYPYPAYPYGPQDTGAQDYPAQQGAGAPPDEYWYYCNEPKGYYP